MTREQFLARLRDLLIETGMQTGTAWTYANEATQDMECMDDGPEFKGGL